MSTPPRRFQFSLRRMFAVSAITACAFAAFGWFCRIVASNMLTPKTPSDLEVFGTLLLLLATGGFSGAAIGTIAGRIVKWVALGIVIGLAACVVVILPR